MKKLNLTEATIKALEGKLSLNTNNKRKNLIESSFETDEQFCRRMAFIFFSYIHNNAIDCYEIVKEENGKVNLYIGEFNDDNIDEHDYPTEWDDIHSYNSYKDLIIDSGKNGMLHDILGDMDLDYLQDEVGLPITGKDLYRLQQICNE